MYIMKHSIIKLYSFPIQHFYDIVVRIVKYNFCNTLILSIVLDICKWRTHINITLLIVCVHLQITRLFKFCMHTASLYKVHW